MSHIETQAQQEFDRWSDAGRAESMARGHHSMTIQCLNQWDLSTIETALDIGCGNGWAVREMCVRGAKKGVGVDISPKMIEREREQAQYNEEYHTASAQNLPFPDNHVDLILSVESLYYYEDPSIALQEWFRVAKTGSKLGILIDLFQENEGSHAWVEALSIPVHLLSISEYTNLLKKAGWSNPEHQFFYDHRPRKKREDFSPDPYWPSYELYLRFKQVGSLCLLAEKS